ncbi:hypothetical protein [Cellulophaga sp. Asnod2-G02]|uniref:hypothetical protein n=1 Tax=Cellulophaga sp. Asnod2-G02 TaxID=3160572 RepID=UPI00387068F2
MTTANKIEDLFKLAYKYYPKDIDCISDKGKYIKTKQYSLLKKIITDTRENSRKEVIEKFSKKFKEIGGNMNFQDTTFFEWQDRCYTFELSEERDGAIHKLRFHISIIIPYYLISYNKIELEGNGSQYSEMPLDQYEDKNDIIKKIRESATEILMFEELDKSITNEVFKDINFEDIPIGHFTLFNAFFLNSFN